METPTVLRWGGGVNSTALALAMHDRGERPDHVSFSDTGNEKPETYDYIESFRDWLGGVGWPDLEVVRYRTRAGDTTLEEWCLRMGQLPSRAFGLGSCADKWKIRPMEKWATQIFKDVWKRGGKPTTLIGYDAGEPQRNRIKENKRWMFRSPLLDWGIDRPGCLDIIDSYGLPRPPKVRMLLLSVRKEERDRAA